MASARTSACGLAGQIGLLLGFMGLVRVEALALGPALVALWLARRQDWRLLARNTAIVLAGVALCIVPWTIRNLIQVDEAIIVTGSSPGHANQVLRVGLMPDFDNHDRYLLLGREPRSLGDSAAYYAKRPWEIITVEARKLQDFYVNDDHFDWIRGFHVPPPLPVDSIPRWAALGNVYYYAVGICAILSIRGWLSSHDRAWLIVVWFILSWSVIHLLLIPQVRYHFPIVPMLSVLAAGLVANGVAFLARLLRHDGGQRVPRTS